MLLSALVIEWTTLLFVLGALALGIAFFINSSFGKVLGVVGLGILSIGYVIGQSGGVDPFPGPGPAPFPSPTPGPSPTPLPTPTPTPAPLPTPQPVPTPVPPAPTPTPLPTPGPAPVPTTQFVVDLRQALHDDGGTMDDAAALAAIFDQFGDTLQYDGTTNAPRILSTTDLGNAFARLQRYRYLQQETPLGTKFARVELRIRSEMTTRGLIAPGQLDQARRAASAQFFHEIGGAFRQ